MKALDFSSPAWPAGPHKALLLACLAEDNHTFQSAWESWRSTQDFESLDQGSSRLMPVLLQQLTRFHLQDPNAGRYRGIQRLHWVRSHRILHRLIDVAHHLETRGINPLLLKGAPLGTLFYPTRALRPMGDGDILVPFAAQHDAIRILTELGWKPKDGITLERVERHLRHVANGIGFSNATGEEIDVHWGLHACASSPRHEAPFWSDAVPITLQGATLQTLSPTHHLFHAIVHGVPSAPIPSFRWIIDASMILNNAGPLIHWDRFLERVESFQLGVLCLHGIAYLHQLLPSLIPDHVRQSLETLSGDRWQWAELRTLTGPPSPRPVAHLWHHYCRQTRLEQNRQPGWLEPGFIRYLCHTLQLDHPWQLLPASLPRILRRIARPLLRMRFSKA